MEVPKGQWIINIFRSPKWQIDHKELNTLLLTNPPDSTTKAEFRICQDSETSGSMITSCKCSGSMAHVHKSCLKLRISRCPEITAQDKRRHVIFCISIFFMLLCLSIVFLAFVNMLDRDEKSKNSTDYITDDILLVVFGVATFVAFFVALISQRHANLSICGVAQKFFRNSEEWTFTSIEEPCNVTVGEVV